MTTIMGISVILLVVMLHCVAYTEALWHRSRFIKGYTPTIDEFDVTFHGKAPKGAPKDDRANRLKMTALKIHAHNSMKDSTYSLEWNQFSDLDDAQYEALLNTKPDRADKNLMTIPQKAMSINSNLYRESIDWSTKDGGKYMTPVKNQGTCGSCWAFTATTVLESIIAISYNTTAVPLSVEQVLSCTRQLRHVQSSYPNNMISSAKGCDGGMTFIAYYYLQRYNPHGLTCEAISPYEMVLNGTSTSTNCDLSSNQLSATWTPNSTYIAIQNDENAIMNALQNGPVSVSIDASGDGFRHYGSGIYDAKDCISDGKTVDHAVLIVGYGVDAKTSLNYWILRNSWGTMWGEMGQMRIIRDSRSIFGPCNIFLYASQPKGLSYNSDNKICTAERVDIPDTTLTFTQLLSFSFTNWLLIIGISLGVIILGSLYVILKETKENQLSKSESYTYRDSILRHKLPTRQQYIEHLQSKTKQVKVV